MKYQVKVDGRVFEVEVEKIGGGYQSLTPSSLTQAPQAPQISAQPAQVQQAPVQQQAPTPAPQAAQKKAAPTGGGETVVSPMPGNILKVNVSNGDSVKAGDVILILEAMKMENEIAAPCDGTVTVNVSVGQTVDTDEVLAQVK